MRVSKSRIIRLFTGLSAALLLGAPAVRAEVEAYDAQGQYVGGLLDIHTTSDSKGTATDLKMFVPGLSRYVVIDDCTGDIVSEQAVVYFRQTNCGGDGFVDNTLFYSIGKIGELYYTGKNEEPSRINAYSALVVDAQGQQSCIRTQQRKMMAVPAQMLKELPFSLPLALPLSFESK